MGSHQKLWVCTLGQKLGSLTYSLTEIKHLVKILKLCLSHSSSLSLSLPRCSACPAHRRLTHLHCLTQTLNWVNNFFTSFSFLTVDPFNPPKYPILPFFSPISVIWFFWGFLGFRQGVANLRLAAIEGFSEGEILFFILGLWDFFFLFFFFFFCFGVLKFEIFVWDFGWLGCNRSWGCDFENSILYVNDAA